MEVGFRSQLCIDQYQGGFPCRQRTLVTSQPIKRFFGSVNLNILYIILKHVVWRFRIYNYFSEILKFRENMSKTEFSKFLKIAKFEYFAKIIIYSKSPDHVL